MPLSRLSVSTFRNISSIDISPDPQFNIIWGQNGSGKTSLLESIFYLSCAKSFKTRLTQSIVQNNTKEFIIHGVCNDKLSSINIGISKSIDGSRKIHIDNEKKSSISYLTYHLPVLLITTTSYRFFHDGPKFRRQLIDWGLFHMKPDFNNMWKSYQNTLKQRNATIKSDRYSQIITTWDSMLAEIGEKINHLRESYVKELKEYFKTIVTQLLPEIRSIVLEYSNGWNLKYSLLESLKQSYQQDNKLGYTTRGPHRADLLVICNGRPASELLSQGQQKLCIAALRIAQGKMLNSFAKNSPIYLIDDLPSELDNEKLEIICGTLGTLKSQTFITCINENMITSFLNKSSYNMFHMKQGSILID